MKHTKKFFSVVLTILLVMSLSTISLAMAPELSFEEWQDEWKTLTSDYGKIALTPGTDETEMRFAWLTLLEDKNPAFRYGRESDMSDFVEAEVEVVRTPSFFYSHKVTLTELDKGTWYYSYRTNNKWTEPESFEIFDTAQGFKLMFCADVQTGRSGDDTDTEVLQNDSYGWYKTLSSVMQLAPDISFILNAGDLVETAISKTQYNLLLAPSYMRSLPMSTAIGNHDFLSSLYHHHFNNPNNYSDTFLSQGGYPYYYSYGDVLFMVLDSNLSLSGDHDELMFEAVNAYPNAKWRVAMLHHSIYSSNGNDESRRAKLAPLFDKYSIDLVLSGHEHTYGRSFPLKGGKIVDSGGSVYLSAGSASGSKIGHTSKNLDYIANAYDFDTASFSILEFSNNSLAIKTYRADNNEMVDEYTIEKDTSLPMSVPSSGAGIFYKIIKWFAHNLIERIVYYIPFFSNYEPII